MVEQMTAADVQRMAQMMLASGRRIEVTMLSE
jgi:(2Fe-2S) ferredoxin